MKKVLLTIVIIILILCGVLFGTYIGIKKNESSNTNDDQELDTSKYEGYTFTDIKTYDESTNGNTVYSLDSEIEYTTKQEVTISPTCDTENDALTYSIADGKVVVIASSGKSHTFTTIKNAKSILSYAYQSCDNITIVILTSDNNIYIRTYDFGEGVGSDEINREDDLTKISSDLKIEKIGISSVLNSIYAYPSIFAKTTDGKIAVVNYNYDENTDQVDVELELTDEVIDADDIRVHEDATVTYGDVSIVDENSNKIYALGIYAVSTAEQRAYDVAYILDRQGYLYQISYDDLNDNMKIYKAKKYSDKIVKKVGTNSNDDVIILFEDGEKLEIPVSVDGSYLEYTVKTFQ